MDKISIFHGFNLLKYMNIKRFTIKYLVDF